MVHYSPVSPVQEAIQVCPATISNYTLATRTVPHYTTIQAELQGCSSMKGTVLLPEGTLKKLFLILHAIHLPVGAQSKRSYQEVCDHLPQFTPFY